MGVVSIIVIAVLLTSLLGTDAFMVQAAEHNQDPVKVKISPDAVYLGAATIISLAAFGSILGIRIKGMHSSSTMKKIGYPMMGGGVIVVIASQWFLVVQACCKELSIDEFAWAYGFTMASLMLVVLGFTVFVDSEFARSTKDQDEQPGQT